MSGSNRGGVGPEAEAEVGGSDDVEEPIDVGQRAPLPQDGGSGGKLSEQGADRRGDGARGRKRGPEEERSGG